MNFTHYHCQNGFAKPVNPFNDMDGYGKWSQFEKWAKENTVSCSEDLSGEYAVELFDSPVVEWCIHVPMGHAFWAKTTQEIADKWNDDFPNNKRKTRQYLQLKPVVKEEKPKVKKSYTGITDALFDQYEKDTINEYVMVNSFHCECPKCGEKYDVTPADGTAINKKVKELEVKQEFGEWISVEQLVNSEFFDVMQDVAKHQRYIAYPLENLLANGYDSQNVGKALRELGVDDKACLWFHKLIFACECLVKNENFKKLEERRVELVCAKYRDKKPSPPKSI